MSLNKCALCDSSRSVMRVAPSGARVCAGAAKRQCADKTGGAAPRLYRGGKRLRTRKDKAGGGRRSLTSTASRMRQRR